jgi:hypothetical protein
MREAFLQVLSAAEIRDSERVRFELDLWERGTSFPLRLMYSAFVLARNFVTDRPVLLFEIQGHYALHRRVVKTQGGFWVSLLVPPKWAIVLLFARALVCR